MSIINEDEAVATLKVLNELGEVQEELAAMRATASLATAPGTPVEGPVR
jgi:hypothetical protein